MYVRIYLWKLRCPTKGNLYKIYILLNIGRDTRKHLMNDRITQITCYYRIFICPQNNTNRRSRSVLIHMFLFYFSILWQDSRQVPKFTNKLSDLRQNLRFISSRSFRPYKSHILLKYCKPKNFSLNEIFLRYFLKLLSQFLHEYKVQKAPECLKWTRISCHNSASYLKYFKKQYLKFHFHIKHIIFVN